MLGEIIADLSNWMYTYLLVILLVAAGLFFTIRNRFPQLRLLREAIRVVVERPEKEGSVSSFQALMVSTASRVGTGNIVGISTAVCLGGYGAVFWMWLIAIIGGASAFVESTLAQIYKRRNPETGESYGGPSYYIEAALHSRPLAVLFAITLILTYAGGFNMVASYNLQSTFSGYSFYDPASTPWVIGAILAVLVGYCLMGGGKRIMKVTSTLVPFMGGIYVLVALIVVVLHIQLLPQVLGRIFSEAFDFQAIFAGFTGSAMMYGIKRGLFSNEAGMGSTPHAHAMAKVEKPQDQGVVAMVCVFIDTFVVLTITALVMITSGALNVGDMAANPAAENMAQVAFSTVFGSFGNFYVAICLLFFAFSTIIGWYFFGEQNVKYLFGVKAVKVYACIAVVCVALGAVLEAPLVWNLSDLFNALMVFPNLLALLALSGLVAKAARGGDALRK